MKLKLTQADRQVALATTDALMAGKPCQHCTNTTEAVACSNCVEILMSFGFAMGVIETENGHANTQDRKPSEKDYLQ